MHARRALLKSLASVNSSFDGGPGAASFAGETWVETRNTTYRFRDGVCFAVVSRGKPRDATSVLVGMRIVGWLAPAGPVGSKPPRLTYTWEAGACAVLWRQGVSGEEDGSVALTSATTDFARVSPARVQALYDASPPSDSSLIRRSAVPSPPSVHPNSRSNTRLHTRDLPPLLSLVPKTARSPSQI